MPTKIPEIASKYIIMNMHKYMFMSFYLYNFYNLEKIKKTLMSNRKAHLSRIYPFKRIHPAIKNSYTITFNTTENKNKQVR